MKKNKNFLLNNLEVIKQKETPFYLYDINLLKQTINEIVKSANKYNYKLHYAFKANNKKPIIDIIRDNGIGADCVSGGEVKYALDNKFNPDSIVFSGVAKNDDEIKLGIENNIFLFNCESISEIEVINDISAKYNRITNIAVRINPNVNANTHHYITTGLEENKFGISSSVLDSVVDSVLKCKNINLKGIHFHIGSQITDWSSYTNLCKRANEINVFFAEKGIQIDHINLGGGIGVDYHNPIDNQIVDFKKYFSLINKFLNPYPFQTIHFEPGRCLVAQAGFLISKVIYVKNGLKTKFLIIDAGMTELIRPTLYQSYHKIENISTNEKLKETYDVVGPVCESSDFFAKNREVAKSNRGDIIAIYSTGAYGETMSSNFNMRKLNESLYL